MVFPASKEAFYFLYPQLSPPVFIQAAISNSLNTRVRQNKMPVPPGHLVSAEHRLVGGHTIKLPTTIFSITKNIQNYPKHLSTINAVRFHNKKLKRAHSQAMRVTKD